MTLQTRKHVLSLGKTYNLICFLEKKKKKQSSASPDELRCNFHVPLQTHSLTISTFLSTSGGWPARNEHGHLLTSGFQFSCTNGRQ